MTLIDRYVADVARRLPADRRPDISRELKSTLLDALEARFGESPSEDDEAALLKEFGSPGKVAASYHPSRQYLIGPQWFPAYSIVLRVHMLALMAVMVIGGVVALVAKGPSQSVGLTVAGLLSNLLHVGIITFAVVTLIFHLVDRSGAGSQLKGREWNPRDLPKLPARDEINCESTFTIVFGAVWVVLLYAFQDRIGIPYNGSLLLNDVVQQYMPWFVMSALLGIAVHGVLLWQRGWRWYTRVAKVATDLFGLYVVYRVSMAVVAAAPLLAESGLPDQITTLVVRIAWAVPFVAGAIILFDAVRMALRARRDCTVDFESVGLGPKRA